VIGRLSLSLAVVCFAGTASAQEPKSLGEFEKWGAYAAGAKGQMICYVSGTPLKSEGAERVKRGAAYVQVSDRQKGKVKGELSVTAGYPYKPESEVQLVIDTTTFALFTKDEGAWARDIKTEAQIVQAMRGGKRMVVHGVSSRGTKTTDTYALGGFSAAVNAINQACGMK
jgi:hypothetical protein